MRVNFGPAFQSHAKDDTPVLGAVGGVGGLGEGKSVCFASARQEARGLLVAGADFILI